MKEYTSKELNSMFNFLFEANVSKMEIEDVTEVKYATRAFLVYIQSKNMPPMVINFVKEFIKQTEKRISSLGYLTLEYIQNNDGIPTTAVFPKMPLTDDLENPNDAYEFLRKLDFSKMEIGDISQSRSLARKIFIEQKSLNAAQHLIDTLIEFIDSTESLVYERGYVFLDNKKDSIALPIPVVKKAIKSYNLKALDEMLDIVLGFEPLNKRLLNLISDEMRTYKSN